MKWKGQVQRVDLLCVDSPGLLTHLLELIEVLLETILIHTSVCYNQMGGGVQCV